MVLIKYKNIYIKIINQLIIYSMNLEGIFKSELQLLNIYLILVTLEVFHLDISGNEDNERHPPNIEFISVTLEIFHLDISGNEDNELQPIKHRIHISNT